MKWNVAFIAMILPLTTVAQNNRYFVSFKDKTNTPYTISQPLQFLSQKSIDRRVKENFASPDGHPAIAEDLPVDPAYVQQVKATGAGVFYRSRWMNGVLVQTDAATASAIAGLSCVSKVELVAPGNHLLGGRKASRKKFEQIENVESLQNQPQLEMIGLDAYHEAGYDGTGVDIALFDDGFVSVDSYVGFRPLFREGRIKEIFNFVENDQDIYWADAHGTATLSILAGNLPGTYIGGAYNANFYLYQTEDVFTEYRIEEYNWLFAAERADSAGVDIISSSLGYSEFDDPSMDYVYANMDGNTTVVSRAARKAFLRGISVVNSAGNEGNNSWKYIIAPADADGVIAVGAVDLTASRAIFSSVGPSADGRVKPDVSAWGVSDSIFGPDGCCYTGSGTSFSGPLISGLVACLRQKYPTATARELYTKVIQSASQYESPDSLLGYGIPNLHGVKIDPPLKDEFELYPNPVAADTLKIIFKEAKGQKAYVSIYTSTGQKVSDASPTITDDNNPISLDCSTFAAGIYYVRVQTNLSTRTVRIVKRN